MIGPTYYQDVEVAGPAGEVRMNLRVTFDQPLSWTPSMANVVEQELKNAVARIVEKAKTTL